MKHLITTLFVLVVVSLILSACGEKMKDPRDGQKYKIVTIGNQTWMAENLNLKTENSKCYSDNADSCAKYGRVYTWDAAMNACPEGWHLSSKSDWETLFETVGGIEPAKKKLGYRSGTELIKDNPYGFSVLPKGNRYWTSTERYSKEAYDLGFNFNDSTLVSILRWEHEKDMLYSVRCVKGAEKETNPRDGHKNKVVKIGNQVWMAENLNIKTEDSYCFNDDPQNCEMYGRLYTWDAAMKACPDGWHLPSDEDWKALFETVGGIKFSGKKLKSRYGWEWVDEWAENGDDSYDFSILPAGYHWRYNYYYNVGTDAWFWSSSKSSLWHFNYNDAGVKNETILYDASVRCIKD